jgi:hypothetical protein
MMPVLHHGFCHVVYRGSCCCGWIFSIACLLGVHSLTVSTINWVPTPLTVLT